MKENQLEVVLQTLTVQLLPLIGRFSSTFAISMPSGAIKCCVHIRTTLTCVNAEGYYGQNLVIV